MALDMHPNREAEQAWQLRRDGQPCSTSAALAILKHVYREAYSSKYIRLGCAEVGFEVGKAVNSSKVLADRAEEIFKTRSSLEVAGSKMTTQSAKVVFSYQLQVLSLRVGAPSRPL